MASQSKRERDYYQILGVLRTASPTEISAAYRGLARQHHPDLSLGSEKGLAELKLINEAYEVLSDEWRRRVYDQRRRPSGEGPDQVPIQSRAPSFKWPLHAATSNRQYSEESMHVELPITPEESIHGGICEFTATLPVPCPACLDAGRLSRKPCETCGGENFERRRESLCVELPPSTPHGTTLRLRFATKNDGAAAIQEFYLRVVVRPCW